MRCIILSIGDELVLGQTVDTNSAWLSQQLAAVGCEVVRHVTVADAQADIEQAIREAAPACDVLVCSGGIGPTEDDLTRQALAAIMGVPLELDQPWLTHLEEFFRKINRPMSALNKIQAMIPRGAQIIENTAGTAAGIRATLPPLPPNLQSEISNPQSSPPPPPPSPNPKSKIQNPKSPTTVFVMPGVPKEMKAMFAADVLPYVRAASGGAVILSRTLHTFGLGESNVADLLKSHGDLMDRRRNPSVGTTVSGGVVSLRLNARFPSAPEAQQQLEETDSSCRAALGDLVYGKDEDTLHTVVGQLLKQSGKTVTTAESCTGGLVAKYLTDLPGSSAYFHQAWVTYSNESKQSQLGVPADLLQQFGAVSEPVARTMAEGARTRAGADYALALSGIAGPDGGTPTKPVGTVCIALASTTSPTYVRTIVFTGDRDMVRDRSAKMALTFLRFALLGKPVTV